MLSLSVIASRTHWDVEMPLFSASVFASRQSFGANHTDRLCVLSCLAITNHTPNWSHNARERHTKMQRDPLPQGPGLSTDLKNCLFSIGTSSNRHHNPQPKRRQPPTPRNQATKPPPKRNPKQPLTKQDTLAKVRDVPKQLHCSPQTGAPQPQWGYRTGNRSATSRRSESIGT